MFKDRHGILELLRAVAATKPAEIREVQERVTDFLRREGPNARLHENKTK
jgi:DNA-binding response OmpR family regulator